MIRTQTSSLAALSNRDFRWYWIALILSAAGTWIQIIAQSLLVLQLSHGRAVALGYVALAQALAFLLFGLFGGTAADRMERRRLLLLTQSILMMVAFIVGILVARHEVQVWMIALAAFVSGSVLSFDQPARNALLPSLVDGRDLMSAISLQSMVFTCGGALAPLLAVLSIKSLGLAGCFFVNSGSYLAMIVALLVLRRRSQENRSSQDPPPRIDRGRAAGGTAGRTLDSIRQLVAVVRRDDTLTWVVSGYALLVFVAPSMQLLLPVLADRGPHSNPMLLGTLFCAFGVGSAGGAVWVTRLANSKPMERLYLASYVVSVVALSVVALAYSVGVYFVALFVLGGAQAAISVLTITLLQSRVAPEMRGRVMSLQTILNMGLRPLGDFPLSALITVWGASAVTGIAAIILGGFCLLVGSQRRFR